MIIKFFSHLNQSLSKFKSTKFAPPPCTPVARAVRTQQHCTVQHFSESVVLKASAYVYFCSLHLLHCSTHRKEIKLKFILQIGYAVLSSGMFFL